MGGKGGVSAALGLMLLCLGFNLTIGATQIAPGAVARAFLVFDDANFDHYAVIYQRLPRALIAGYVGALMASCGAVFQGLTGNPLASPSTLGVTTGAALGTVLAVYLFDLPMMEQGVAALVGGGAGFVLVVMIARFAGLSHDPRGLSLILAGAMVSILLAGAANALLLTDPGRRAEYLSWLAGNVNHMYADRLAAFWPIGGLAFALLWSQARGLTLLTLGREKAASAGVSVRRVQGVALTAAVLGASSAVAICGPVSFVGLVVPHMVRPFVRTSFAVSLPANAMMGAAVCLLADLCARRLFLPYTLNTGVLLDLIGGVVFAVVVKRTYLSAHAPRGTT